jgi:hypothetical protein
MSTIDEPHKADNGGRFACSRTFFGRRREEAVMAQMIDALKAAVEAAGQAFAIG